MPINIINHVINDVYQNIMYNCFLHIIENITDDLIIIDPCDTIIYHNKDSSLINKNITGPYPELFNVLIEKKIYKNKKIIIDNLKLIIDSLTINHNLYQIITIHAFDHIKDDDEIIDSDIYIDETSKEIDSESRESPIIRSPNKSVNKSFGRNNNEYCLDIHSNKSNKVNNFIAFLSHELRNPLQSITFAGQLLDYKNQNKDSEISTNINIINRSCISMKKIINDVLDMTKINAGEFSIEYKNCDIKEILDDLIDDHNESIKQKNISLTYNILQSTQQTICTDRVRLYQILSNLVSNAIKYSMHDKAININVSIEEKDVKYFKFSIQDQGIGIQQTELSTLFKTFCQTSNNQKSHENSNGLGLAISQKISHLLGGFITVKSKYSVGSIFSLFHPLVFNAECALDAKITKTLSLKNINGSILIIEDNESNLLLLKMLLDQYNYIYNFNLKIRTVLTGTNNNKSNDIIERCIENPSDIIFMDINMIEIDGHTLCTTLRKKNYNHTIIAMTGNIEYNVCLSDQVNKSDYFNEILIKPFDDKDILKLLLKYM